MSQKSYADLIELPDFPFPVYMSEGTERRALAIAHRAKQAYSFLRTALGYEANLCLLILAPRHWQQYTGSPMFGVPQTIDAETVVVAGLNSELWSMIVPSPESLPYGVAEAMRTTYAGSNGSIDIAPYMDLLPVHEIGHLFVDQAAGQFDFHSPRRWLVELYCNLCLHSYVVAQETEQLPCLQTFPEAVVAAGFDQFAHRRLEDFEHLYAGMEPPNFVWYLSQLHVAAGRLYDAGGLPALQNLYNMIVQSRGVPTDEQLAAALSAEVHPALAQVQTSWPLEVSV